MNERIRRLGACCRMPEQRRKQERARRDLD
jgi:hypothetical protein